MDSNHLVYRLVSIIGGGLTRDIEAEDALTRALARNGGDGLTACNPDAGACPKPCLRHRRVNAGIWPNWRCNWSNLEFSRWHDCPLALPGTTIGGYLDAKNCGTYQDHLDREKKKAWLADLVKRHQRGEPVALWNMTGDELARQPPVTWSSEPSRPSWAQNGQERIWWDRNLGSLRSSEPPDTTWYAQYPSPVADIEIDENGNPWGRSILAGGRRIQLQVQRTPASDPPPVESPQPSSSLAPPSLDAALPPPEPDSEA